MRRGLKVLGAAALGTALAVGGISAYREAREAREAKLAEGIELATRVEMARHDLAHVGLGKEYLSTHLVNHLVPEETKLLHELNLKFGSPKDAIDLRILRMQQALRRPKVAQTISVKTEQDAKKLIESAASELRVILEIKTPAERQKRLVELFPHMRPEDRESQAKNERAMWEAMREHGLGASLLYKFRVATKGR